MKNHLSHFIQKIHMMYKALKRRRGAGSTPTYGESAGAKCDTWAVEEAGGAPDERLMLWM